MDTDKDNYEFQEISIDEILPDFQPIEFFKKQHEKELVARKRFSSGWFYNYDYMGNYFEKYFYLIKNAVDNKKMIIKYPFTDTLIESDIYFFSATTVGHIVCTYYFPNENILMALKIHELDVMPYYIIDITQKKYFMFKEIHIVKMAPHPWYNNRAPFVYFDRINKILTKGNLANVGKMESKIKTLHGVHIGLSHEFCSYVNAVYIMDTIGFKNEVDELYINVNNNTYHMDSYYKSKYKNIKITEIDTLTGLVDNQLKRGVFFMYMHHFCLNSMFDFYKSFIYKTIPISINYLNEIEHIKNNYYPIISVNLRKINSVIENHTIIISNLLLNLKKIYPNCFFLIGGFCGDYNNDKINKLSVRENKSYDEFKKVYENEVELVTKDINSNDFKSLIDLKVNNIIKFSELTTFSIHLNSGYVVFDHIINNKPCIDLININNDVQTKWRGNCRENSIGALSFFKTNMEINAENIIKLVQDNEDYLHGKCTFEESNFYKKHLLC